MQNRKEKIIAALLAFFLGEWGVHKFYLNEQESGKKYLIWCVVGVLTSWFLIGLIPLVVLFVKKIIDGINYLLMTDEEFDGLYNEKTWVSKKQLKDSIKVEHETNCAMSLVKSEEYNIIDIKFPFERNFEEVKKKPAMNFDYDYVPEYSDEFVLCSSSEEINDLFRDEDPNNADELYAGHVTVDDLPTLRLPREFDGDGNEVRYFFVGLKKDGKRRFYLRLETI